MMMMMLQFIRHLAHATHWPKDFIDFMKQISKSLL